MPWKYWNGEIIPSEEYDARKRAGVAVSNLPFPMVMSDQIEPVRSMVDGKWYDSKAALRATYLPSGNAEGHRFIEVGNEELKPAPKKKPDRKAIRDSVRKAAARVGLPTV